MAAVTTVVEGNIKFREGKKWKSRWCVVKKPSPVADHLQVILYKNVYESAKPDGKWKSVFTLDAYFGLDASGSYDREPYVLAIICAKNVFLFAFEQREEMIKFEIKIRQSLGEEHHFLVKIVKAPPSTKVSKEQLNLIIHDTRFCLTVQSPPKILLSWSINDLRRYGLRDGKFCFEGGTNCGKGAGLFALQSDQIETVADIIHFAATGKMSNCHRKFKNRSSQFDLGGHLIADIPSMPSQSSSSHLHPIHHTVAKGPLQGALPATLNCCHDSQTGSAESEDWNWYKRHSVSVMDYRRISALREKASAETRDQLAMGTYDIPPNHDRRLDTGFSPANSGHGNDHPRSFSQGPENCISNTYITSTSDRHEYCNTSDSRVDNSGDHYKYLKGGNNASESRELLSFNVDNGEGPNSPSMSRTETLQTLKKQEYNIQKEMKLLDEMLLNCADQNEETTVSACGGAITSKCQLPNRTSKNVSRDSSYANYDEVPMRLDELENGIGQESVANHSDTNSSGATSGKDFEIISGNISVVKANPVYLKNKKPLKPSSHLNKTLPDETPISPLFHAKLNNIPSGSKLNAPLPYVNLSRYDDDSNSHVHLPGSADCLLVARGSSFSSLSPGKDNQNRARVVWRHHSGSLSSLHTPVAASSLTNLSQFSELQSTQARFQLRQAVEGKSIIENEGHPEVLVVNLEGKREAWERHKSSSVKLPSEKVNRSNKRDSDIVSLLTSDLHRREQEREVEIKSEGIYENLPVAAREDSPPPALPPKGPALLKKMRAAAAARASANNTEPKYKPCTLSPPTPHRQNRSFSSFHDSSFGYDHNQEGSHQDLSTSEGAQVDENYLHMGSPKMSHKFAATVPMVLPSKKKMGSKFQVRDDYMDMAAADFEGSNAPENSNHEDEIYLDVEETLKSSTKNPPERRLSGKSVPLGLPPVAGGVGRESTYVEMATVSNRKSMVVQNLETLQAYVSKKPGGEKGGSTTSTSATTPPPLPRPYKVRHNSDSGLSSKEIEDLEVSPEKPKSKSPMKIYSKVKPSDSVSRSSNDPPLPFQNLMDFTKKTPDNRSTYVNTYINAEKNLAPFDNNMRSIPLPEPVKEGFLARFKRRSSRDKGSPAPEKTGNGKNRSSILERSMSEHDSPRSNKEEKNSKLKIGRRRSSSFPNRLSYQEGQDDDSCAPASRKNNASSSSFSSSSMKSKASFNPTEQGESSSSVHDYSDDSDVSPLLKRVGRKVKPTAATVLHVQQNQPIDKNLYMHTSRSTSCLISQIPNSSKTDDEKLCEILFKRPSQRRSLKNSFNDSTTFEVSMEKSHMPGMTHEKQKISKGNTSEYCLMDPPKSEFTMQLSVATETTTGSCAPALPPKSRNYQNLLSPVLEATVPSIPPRPRPTGAAEPADSESGETVMDQYVELSRSFGNHDDSTDLKNTLDSKAGRLSDGSTRDKTVTSIQTCTTITLPLPQNSGYSSDIDISDSPPPSAPFNIVEGDSPCANPAKSVLRPRSGKEYALIQRVPGLPTFRLQSASLASFSPTLSHVFNYDLDPQKSSQESTLRRSGGENQCYHHPHPQHHHHHHHHHHDHQGLCNCTSKSDHSSSVRHIPQSSPSLASNSDTLQSNSSLSHDQKEPPKPSLSQSMRTRLTSLSVSTLSSMSPSPGASVPHHQSFPWFNSLDLSAKLSPLASGTRGDVFFPDEISVSTISDVTQCNPLDEDYHVYVNQEFVMMHQKSSGGRQNSFSSQSSASPQPRVMHSCLSLYLDSLQSKNTVDTTDASKGARQRSRNSESDAIRAAKKSSHSHSFGAGDKLQKNFTLPSSVHRSHSDPKRGLKSYPHPPRSKSHVHEKKYDKFAQSCIIARRRQQHTPVLIESPQSGSTDTLPIVSNVFNSSPGLQVPALKSSGYKNLDRLKAVTTPDSDNLSQSFMHCDASPTPSTFESQLSPGYMDASFPSGASPIVMTSTPNPATKAPSPSPNSVTPPPLPPRRLSVSSSMIFPPQTPQTYASDSPPPYRAPPPPLFSKDIPAAAIGEDSLSSGSSDDEAELIYIEVDMTKRQDEAPKVPSVSLSRRTRRARQQQKDLAKLRYAEIDHTATKALKDTGEKLRDDRRSRGVSALPSRKGASFSSKSKSSYQREHSLSTHSIESC